MKDTRVTEKSLKGYALKDTHINEIQRMKDVPLKRLQRKVSKVTL